jgi:hypothetical protein
MNFVTIPDSAFQETAGNAILVKKLESNKSIKTYFVEGEKTPFVDGRFLPVNLYKQPENEFVVQIKTKENVGKTEKGTFYDCDTKFINWINVLRKQGSVCPAMLLVVDMETENIYWKYLSDEFLKKNDFTETAQGDIRVYFEQYELLSDMNIFRSQLDDIIEKRKAERYNFHLDTYEYQKAFDVINGFFDNNFPALKEVLFKDLWKFGIAYKKEYISKEDYEQLLKERAQWTECGITTSNYATSFGMYLIPFSSPVPTFSEINPYELEPFGTKKTNLKLVGHISGTNFTETTIETLVNNWIEDIFRNAVMYKFAFVKFMPDEVLFEIAYEFLDKHSKHLGNEFSSTEFIRLVREKYPHKYINWDITLLQITANELDRRKIENIERLWLPRGYCNNGINYYRGFKDEDYINNIEKLVKNLPQYYFDFLNKLTPLAYIYKKGRKYFYKFYFCDNDRNGYKSFIYDRYSNSSENFEVNILTSSKFDLLNRNDFECWGSGYIRADFSKTPLLDNLLSILYKSVLEVHNFEDRHARLNLEVIF